MTTYILTYGGSGERPDDVAARVSRGGGSVRLVERIGDSLVVEGDKDEISALMRRLTGWFGSPERRIPHPRGSRARPTAQRLRPRSTAESS